MTMKSKITDQLGTLLEPDLHGGITLSDNGSYAGTEDGYKAETVLRLLASERERCARLIEPHGSRPGGNCCSVREFDALTYAAKIIRRGSNEQ